ncbi:hypothetical protein LCGC14_1099780 [marine sediment metagenome]|uniref:Uncharacterized protein n=1 Tax=marine sediment metagenome TaxID=412755 RepID=A0A0F9PSY6_9ZZZZ
MNETDLFHILIAGMTFFVLLSILWAQDKRIVILEKLNHTLTRDLVIVTTARDGDLPTARLMAAVAKQSAGAPLLTPEPEKKKHKFTIEQSAG